MTDAVITSFDPIPTPFSTPVVQAPLTISKDDNGNWITSLDNLANTIVHGAETYYGTQAKIDQAKANAAISHAQGANAVQVAKVGLPSPQLLLFGGLGIVALMLITDKKRR